MIESSHLQLDKDREFSKAVRKRVNSYFKERGISVHGNWIMKIKMVVMLAIYFVPYVLLITGVITNGWLALFMSFLMGMGMATIGLAVMHDANHDSFSKNRKFNKVVGMVLNLLGGSAINWKIQHNVLHHTYTNVNGMDEDIDPGMVLRFSPGEKRRWFHSLQHFYAWFLYGLMTVSWVTLKDFKQLVRYKRQGLLQGQKTTMSKEMSILIISKVVYYSYIIVLPLIFTEFTWYQILMGFFTLHFTCGLFLSMIFQPAHVMETSEFHEKEAAHEAVKSGAAHQLRTTTNFGTRAKVFTWFIGGLNFQIEHHLFPNVCHIHYPKISKIVRETAAEFNLPYHEHKTFAHALVAHGAMLKKLGRA